VGMLFCPLGRAHSLREIEGGLKSWEGKLAHLGITFPVRSSLSYANSHRPLQLFEKVFYGLFETVAAKAVGKKKFRFKNKLVSLDSTVIDLCLSLYGWAKFRRTKGGSSSIWYSTMRAICPVSASSPRGRCMMSERPIRWISPPA